MEGHSLHSDRMPSDGWTRINIAKENGFLAGFSARDAEIKMLTEALKTLNKHLTIPAAEYVPAIPEAWKIIEEALAKWKEEYE